MSILLNKLFTVPVCTLACAMGFVAACDGDSLPPDGGRAIVTIDTLARFQTMTGWEATAQSAQADPRFPAFRNSLFDQAANDLGINRIRIPIHAGAENPVDFGGVDDGPNRCPRWNTVNDNDNPRVINPAGFHFITLDSTVVTVIADPVTLRDLPATVLDLLAAPNQRGIPGSSLSSRWLPAPDSSRVTTSPVLTEVRSPRNGPSWYAVARGDMQSIVIGRHHYIRNGDGREELFDIFVDPWETVDLAKTEGGKATLLAARAALDSATRFSTRAVPDNGAH